MTCLSCVDGSDHSFMLSVQCTLDSHSLDRYRYMIQYQFNGFSIIFKLVAGTVFSRGSSVVRYK